MKRNGGDIFHNNEKEESKEIKQIKTTNLTSTTTSVTWLQAIDANILSIISNFLPLKSQLHLRLVSTTFNEIITEGNIKILLDYLKYWNEEIISKHDKLLTITSKEETVLKPYLQWTFGAQLRCNAFIENHQILNEKDDKDFNDEELSLFTNGIVEIIESICGSGVSEVGFGSFCKLKWNIMSDENNIKSLTFIQHFFEGFNSREETNGQKYVLSYFENDNENEVKCLIDICNDCAEAREIESIVYNEELLEKIRTEYCNHQLETQFLNEFLSFLMKCGNCENSIDAILEVIEECDSRSEGYSYPFGDDNDMEEYVKKGINDMNVFIEKYDWTKYDINTLQKVINLMKSIAIKTDLKVFKPEKEDYEKKRFYTNNLKIMKEQIKEQLKTVCNSTKEESCSISVGDYGREFEECGEAVFHLSTSNESIQIKYIISYVYVYGDMSFKKIDICCKKLEESNWKCFYSREIKEYEELKLKKFKKQKNKESIENVKKMFGFESTVYDREFIYALLFNFKSYKIIFCYERGVLVDQIMGSQFYNYELIE
ncbi:hypothetical protein ABK040_014531 [Willaertia magna]